MMKVFTRGLVPALVIAGLNACGGAGGSLLAGGGISGTGTGTITGFGSIIINDTREFSFDADTRYFLDGDPVTDQAALEALLCGGPCGATNPGMVARVDIGPDVSNDFTSGTAVTVNAINLVKGPVTGAVIGTSPLQVLEQTLIVTGDTVLVNVPGNDVANLALSDVVEVSGFADASNVIQATRIEFKGNNNTGTLVWKLTGPVSSVVANTSFMVGSQLVLLNGVVPRDCTGGLANGDLVEVRASEDPGFVAGGDTLDTVTDVECQAPGLGVPPGTAGTVLEAEVEGLVSALACAGGDIVVGGQCVDYTSVPAVIENGDAGDFVPGAKLEAEGRLNTGTGVLTADRIRFRENRVRIEGPVNIPGAGVGSAFTILDVVNVNTTALTDDPDGIITGTATGNTQVEVRGFVDGNGDVFATELRDRGTGTANDVRLRGPTTETCDGAADTTLSVLGVSIDTASNAVALVYLDETVEPPVTLADNVAFCALISVGSNIEVENGVFTSGPPPLIDDGEQYSIEDL